MTREIVRYDRVPFLLETKWDRPEPVKVTQIKRGKKKLDVIQTIFDSERIDFIYDPEEMLVLQVDFYDEKLGMWKSYKFSEYTEINGIKMPAKWASRSLILRNDKFRFRPIKFALNVEYDPKLFERPLRATTPDAWKPQSK